MSSSSFRVDVDDTDARILYSDGWTSGLSDKAYDRTVHFAVDEGLTATLTFNGTMAGVMGCGGDRDAFGWPSMSVVIDGRNYDLYLNRSLWELVAPLGPLHYNLSLFTSPPLAPAEHTLVLTNLNGTPPNVFILDRFWYITSDATGTSGTAGQPSGTDSAVPHGLASTTPPHQENVGAIVGGVLGGAAVLLLALLGIRRVIKRRLARHPREISFVDSEMVYSPAIEHISPFTPAVAYHPQATTSMIPSLGNGLAPLLQAPETRALLSPPSSRPARRDPSLISQAPVPYPAHTQGVRLWGPSSKLSPIAPRRTTTRGFSSPSHSLDETSLPPYVA